MNNDETDLFNMLYVLNKTNAPDMSKTLCDAVTCLHY